MTNEEAIEILKSMRNSPTFSYFVCEALDVAINAINRLSEESETKIGLLIKKQDKYKEYYFCNNCRHSMTSPESICPFCGIELTNWPTLKLLKVFKRGKDKNEKSDCN